MSNVKTQNFVLCPFFFFFDIHLPALGYMKSTKTAKVS